MRTDPIACIAFITVMEHDKNVKQNIKLKKKKIRNTKKIIP